MYDPLDRTLDCERLAFPGPAERLGQGLVEIGDEAGDTVAEILGRGERAAAQDLAGEDGEPEFDLVEPGGMLGRDMLGREVKADAVIGIAQEGFAAGPALQD